MDQVRLFLTEYSSWIIMAVCGFVVILLVVALHRIRKIGRLIKENTADTRRVLEYVEHEVEVRRNKEEKEQKHDPVGIVDKGVLPVATAVLGDAPEELIDAVLEEVFP